ncbi:MAG: ABC transporter substrate-binding protein [Chitinivibrionales bacterium]|nr:ABC transporter substrate-binding protein [Chitinivibrionales bacterium]
MHYLCIVICTVSLFLGCSLEKKEILIGAVFPMTGNIATFGVSSKNGMLLAIEEWNNNGGIVIGRSKMKIRPIIEDSEGKQEKAVSAVEKLIGQDGVKSIIGEIPSMNSLAIAPICQEMGVPMITTGSTNPKVTEIGDYIFRACYIDPFQGLIMAQFVYNDLKARRASVLYDNSNEYAMGLAEVFKLKFEEYGGKVVAFESFTGEAATVDCKQQLTRIKRAKSDFLYIPNYYEAVANITKQANALGIKAPLGGGDGWDSPELLSRAAAFVEGGYFTNHFSVDDPSAIVAEFVKKYEGRFGTAPDALAVLAYDATSLLLAALDSCASLEGREIKEAIRTISMDGVSGSIRFDERRNPIKSAVILQIKNGKQVFITRVNPS